MSVSKTIAQLEDSEGDTATVQRAVVGRYRFPTTAQIGFVDIALPPPPAEDAWAKPNSVEQAEVGRKALI